MKKWDFIIIFSTIAMSLTIFLCITLIGSTGETITISQNNSIVYEGRLSVNKQVKLSTNTVEIKDGKVKMDYSTCKNQICVKHRHISKKDESIICLPNKVIIEIK